MTEGYVKLHRSLLKNPLSKKPDYAWLWCVLIMKANHKETQYVFNNKKYILMPGQLISGRKSLSSETGISQSKVYRILKYLENEQQIEQQTNNQFTLITILNWGIYQSNGTINKQPNEQPVNNGRTTSEQPVNTDKNDNNDNNEKKKIKHLDFVYLFEDEYKKLIEQIGEDKTKKTIEKLNCYIGSKGKKYKSHYFTILNWIKMEEDRKPNKKQKTFSGDYRV
jgi:hypothetical protein